MLATLVGTHLVQVINPFRTEEQLREKNKIRQNPFLLDFLPDSLLTTYAAPPKPMFSEEAQEALRAAQASEPASPAERQAVKSLGLEDWTASADSSMYSSRGRVFVKRLEQSLH